MVYLGHIWKFISETGGNTILTCTLLGGAILESHLARKSEHTQMALKLSTELTRQVDELNVRVENLETKISKITNPSAVNKGK